MSIELDSKKGFLTIEGIPLDDDGLYVVSPKYDGDAPDGFKAQKSTKVFQREVGRNTEAVPFHDRLKLWNTGLFEQAPMYRGLNQKDRKKLIKKVEDYVVKPFEDIRGEGILDPRDEKSEFWNNYKIRLYNGRIFNTSQPEDRLELFLCLSLKKLAPKGMENDHDFKHAQFSIENKEEQKTLEQEDSYRDLEVSAKFAELLKDEDKLKLVLEHVGLTIPAGKLDPKVMATVFRRFITDKRSAHENKEIFLESAEKSESKDGYTELYFYSQLKEMQRKGKVQRDAEFYVIDETRIGTNLKEAAANMLKDKSLQELVVGKTDIKAKKQSRKQNTK